MSAEVLALGAGTVLAVGALAYVLYPLFFPVREPGDGGAPVAHAPQDSAIVALREIEFDRATGKLSDTDYAELRSTYGARALAEMRTADRAAPPAAAGAAAPPADDPIEARVRAYRMQRRECATCGLRPEADATFCSTCGGYLDRACHACRAPVTEPGAAYCSQCGART